MAKELTYNELLQENLELKQTIEELRKYYKELSKFAATINESKPTLTDEELEAIEVAIDRFHDYFNGFKYENQAKTLLNLLERIKDK